MWSYVYNIMRIFSSRSCQGSEPDVSMPCIPSAGENRNPSKIQKSELLPLQQFSSVEDHVEVDVSTFEGTTKVHSPSDLLPVYLQLLSCLCLKTIRNPQLGLYLSTRDSRTSLVFRP